MKRENLIKARKENRLTQQQVADAIKISHSYYQMLEYGSRTGTVEIWDRLEKFFKIHQKILRETLASDRDREDNQ